MGGDGWGGNEGRTNEENNAINTDAVFGTNYHERYLEKNSAIDDQVDTQKDTSVDILSSALDLSSILDTQVTDSYFGLNQDPMTEMYDSLGLSDTLSYGDTYTVYDDQKDKYTTVSFDSNTGRYNVTSVSSGLFGNTENHISTDSVGNVTSDKTTNSLGYSYDTHYGINNSNIGFISELLVDVLETLDINLSRNSISTLDTFVGVVSLGLSLTNVPSTITALSNIGKVSSIGKFAIAISSIATAKSIYDDLDKLSAQLEVLESDMNSLGTGIGSKSGLGLEGYDTSSGGSSLDEFIRSGEEEFQTSSDTMSLTLDPMNQIESMMNLEVYNKMAGGTVFNEILAGGDIFDASIAPNINSSIGNSLTLSDHAKSINYPYEDMAGGKFYG